MSAQAATDPRGAAPAAASGFVDAFAAQSGRLPGSGTVWLDDYRQSALEQFTRTGFPGRRDEQWKYTNIAPIEKRSFAFPEVAMLDAGRLDPHLFEGLGCRRLVFVNGWFSPGLSSADAADERLQIGSLADVLRSDPSLVQPYLERSSMSAANGFGALNAAFLADGAFIHLPRNTAVDEPIHLVYVTTAEGGEIAAHPRNLIVAADGARGTVIESYVGLDESVYLTNVGTEVILGANAALDHYTLQQESVKAFHVGTLRVQQMRDSRFVSHTAAFGARLSRRDIDVLLDGEGAGCDLDGLYMVDGRQHVDIHTTVDHAKPHGRSREYYKGILGGRSRGVFNGRVHVHPGAQKTDSEQTNKNLLLSRDAEVDTKPELEIYADDVKCSHGATVGQLDGDMLFYLRSRGIDREAARGLLTYGFAKDIVDRMNLEPVRQSLEQVLLTRVPDSEHVREMV